MSGILACLYGGIAYLVFFATFLYLIGFVGDLWVPKSVSSGGGGGPLWFATAVNTALLVAFGLQHSTMARPGFKRWWVRFVPVSIERSTYVLVASLVLIALFWLWQPMPSVIWSVQQPWAVTALYALFAAGWLIVLLATFHIDHFELFGLRQVYARLRGRSIPRPRFMTPFFYRVVRHPLNAGFLLAFWAAPEMTAGRLLLAMVWSAYILFSIPLEERDLIGSFGDDYRRYRERVPGLVPLAKGMGTAARSREENRANPISRL